MLAVVVGIRVHLRMGLVLARRIQEPCEVDRGLERMELGVLRIPANFEEAVGVGLVLEQGLEWMRELQLLCIRMRLRGNQVEFGGFLRVEGGVGRSLLLSRGRRRIRHGVRG